MLATFYKKFEEMLIQDGTIAESNWRTYAGQRFFYVRSTLPAPSVTNLLLEIGEQLSAGTKLKPECIYVRSDEHGHVYRFRFLVPSEKQFCCGNLCEDCFLLREHASPSS